MGDLTDFTLSNARRFYSSKGEKLGRERVKSKIIDSNTDLNFMNKMDGFVKQKACLASCYERSHRKLDLDPMQKWLPLYYSFVRTQNSLTNLVFERKIVKNLLSRTR